MGLRGQGPLLRGQSRRLSRGDTGVVTKMREWHGSASRTHGGMAGVETAWHGRGGGARVPALDSG